MPRVVKTCPECAGSGRASEVCPKSSTGLPHKFYKENSTKDEKNCVLCGKPKDECISGLCKRCNGAGYIDD